MRSNLRHWVSLSLAIFPALLLGLFLRGQWAYQGPVAGDLLAHSIYVEHFTRAFLVGSLGLETWDQLHSGGSAYFRVYQNLSHMLAALLNTVWGGKKAGEACALLMCIAFSLQCLASWKAALWLGFSSRTALFCAWLSPLVSSILFEGHDLKAYLLPENGFFPQALAIPVFTLSIGWLGKQLNTLTKDDLKLQDSFALGIGVGLTFLLHQLYGYVALLGAGIFFAVALTLKRGISQRFFLCLCFVLLGFLLVTGYQLWSLLADLPLTANAPYETATRLEGLGIQMTLKALLGGEFLDKGRVPFLTFLAAIGVIDLFRNWNRPSYKALGLFAVLLIILISGPKTFGKALLLIPGLSSAHFDRFGGALHVMLIFLSALGAESILSVFTKKEFSIREPGRLLIGAGIIFGIGFCWVERFSQIKESNNQLITQQKFNSRLDPKLFASAGNSAKEGNLFGYGGLMLGEVPLIYYASAQGYSQISLPFHTLTYSSFGLALSLNLTKKETFEVFNISGFLAPAPVPVAGFLKALYQANGAIMYSTPSRGFWDVVSLSKVETVKDPQTWLDRMEDWLKSSDPKVRRYVSFVPEKIANAWPAAVPSFVSSQIYSPDLAGSILKSTALENQKASANFNILSEGAYALFRVGFHPRWKFTVNGAPIAPQWLGPGQIGFPLPIGRHEVVAEFPPDPIRSWLFFLSIFTWLGSLVCLMFVHRPQVEGRLQRKVLHPQIS